MLRVYSRHNEVDTVQAGFYLFRWKTKHFKLDLIGPYHYICNLLICLWIVFTELIPCKFRNVGLAEEAWLHTFYHFFLFLPRAGCSQKPIIAKSFQKI